MPAAARSAGAVWSFKRSGAAVRFDPACGTGIAVCDAPHVEGLHADSGRAGAARERRFWVGGERSAQAEDRASLSAGTGGRGAARSGRAEDDGESASDNLKLRVNV